MTVKSMTKIKLSYSQLGTLAQHCRDDQVHRLSPGDFRRWIAHKGGYLTYIKSVKSDRAGVIIEFKEARAATEFALRYL